MKQRLLLIFTVWFLMTAPAFAGFAHVDNTDTFGELVKGPGSHTSTGNFNLTVTSEVYKYTGIMNLVQKTIYTYLWTLQATSYMTLFTVDAGGFDYDYGTVGAPTDPLIVDLDGNLSFSFLLLSGDVTFYAQSAKGPGHVDFWASGGGGSSSSVGDPDVYTYGPTTNSTAVPEPSTLSLLGFGLLAAGFFRKKVLISASQS